MRLFAPPTHARARARLPRPLRPPRIGPPAGRPRACYAVTLIEDAYTLWAKLKAERGQSDWNPELDEEFEDGQGNVMNRKTYADLARQGLLD